jgi:alginate O-acetyltransferase complex protein AlgI
MTLGIFQKVVLADTLLAPQSEAVFNFAGGPLSVLDSWIGVLAFSGQIFFDFSGYSICAIGAALCLGFSLPDNFRFPYAAIGFSDFWRRWHISLSSWLRDYLYIPLGGNRASGSRTVVNLMLVMLIGGLWHGASWTFVVWGGLHGLYLVVERFLSKRWGTAAWVSSMPGKILLGLFTYFLVNITWVFFRADTFASAGLILLSMFGIPEVGANVHTTIGIWQVTIVIAALLVMHWSLRNTDRLEESADKVPIALHTLVWCGMIVALILTQGGGDAFIYFQF